MPQTPDTMFADKGYEGWDKLSPYQKVERMMEIHKSGHEGEDVSDILVLFVEQETSLSPDHFITHLILEISLKRGYDIQCFKTPSNLIH